MGGIYEKKKKERWGLGADVMKLEFNPLKIGSLVRGCHCLGGGVYQYRHPYLFF